MRTIFDSPGRFSLLSILTVMVILTSCKGGSNSAERDMLSADSLSKELFTLEIATSVYPLPTPFEMTTMLRDIGATYNPRIVNPADHVSKYLTEHDKAVNLGIYGADLSYASTFQHQQDIQTYLGAVKTLGDQLGIDTNYEVLLSDEYREKFNNRDSLISIISETIFDAYQYLDERSNPDLSVLMVTGVWIELMYIATHISEDSYNYSGIVDIIVNQRDSYENILILLNSRNNLLEIKNLAAKLQVLKPVYDKAAAGLSPQDYETILLTIRSVRNSIIA